MLPEQLLTRRNNRVTVTIVYNSYTVAVSRLHRSTDCAGRVFGHTSEYVPIPIRVDHTDGTVRVSLQSRVGDLHSVRLERA